MYCVLVFRVQSSRVNFQQFHDPYRWKGAATVSIQLIVMFEETESENTGLAEVATGWQVDIIRFVRGW